MYKSFFLGQTTWIGYAIKNICQCIHFNRESEQKKLKHLPTVFEILIYLYKLLYNLIISTLGYRYS